MPQPLIFSFSGPSSSGKSDIISHVKKYLEDLNYTVYVRGSLSRANMNAETTLADRRNPDFQLQLLDEAIAADQVALNSGAEIILMDRTILDGYVYFKKYDTASPEQLEAYYVKVCDVLKTYTQAILLQQVVFQSDDVRLEFDKQFAKDFVQEMQYYWPKDSCPLSIIPQIFGIFPLVSCVLDKINTYLKASRVKKSTSSQIGQ